jgi:hypothetical protein
MSNPSQPSWAKWEFVASKINELKEVQLAPPIASWVANPKGEIAAAFARIAVSTHQFANPAIES